jgi:hypothetical protein
MLMSPNWLMPRKNQVHGLIVWSTLPESEKRKSGKIVAEIAAWQTPRAIAG